MPAPNSDCKLGQLRSRAVLKSPSAARRCSSDRRSSAGAAAAAAVQRQSGSARPPARSRGPSEFTGKCSAGPPRPVQGCDELSRATSLLSNAQMEEILIDDVVEKCVTTPTAITSTSGGGSDVMPVVYIQPASKLCSTSSKVGAPVDGGSEQLVVVNNSTIAINQILLQGLGQIGQNPIQPPITITKQINKANTTPATQTQKHILVQKPNASVAQIMPLTTSQESTVITQAGGKSSLTYALGTILKPQLQAAAGQIKSKIVFGPVISTIAPTPGGSSILLNQASKQDRPIVTNLLLPVGTPQHSVSVGKQSVIKPNLKFNNGQIKTDSKTSAITVLRESKTANAAANPPPLHSIVKMNLVNASKNSNNSAESIKISENPDSAVITPIPKADDSSTPEKRKKTISNILRGSTEKRVKKQSFSKSSPDASVTEMSDYASNSPESDHERDKKKDSDDEITFLKVVANDEKKIGYSLSSDVKIEIIKGSTGKEVEIIENIEKVNGQPDNDETEGLNLEHQSDPNFDATKVLDWKDGVGTLPGSTLKFCMNEFGLMEVIEQEENKQEKEEDVGDKENVCLTQNSSKSSTSTVVEKKTEDKKRSPSAEIFYCCEACGCHGLVTEFESPVSCSPMCTEFLETNKKKARKEKDLNKEIGAKRKRKKMLEEQPTKKRDKIKDSSPKPNGDEKTNDSKDKCDRLDKVKTETDEDTKDTNITLGDEESQGETDVKYPWQTGKHGFVWAKYLDYTKAKAAPTKLFKDVYPYGINNFKVGMKLEGIDPNNQSLYCVLTIAEVVGYRLRLHFDGYPENFDFWANADSMDIFPVGWTEKNGHKLQPPKSYVQSNFSWTAYLKSCKAIAAPKNLFDKDKKSILPTGFRVGMKLEAVDRKHSASVCVASVADVMDSRILVHFDSWDNIYDYWADVTSPYIHPVGWCQENGHKLTPPNYYKDRKSFSWEAYLKDTSTLAAPARAFKQRNPCGFKCGMKFEAVDKRVPQLIRVATVDEVKDHRIRIRFDGWPENHAYWIDDDSPDIHPSGWCAKTGHSLEIPLTHESYNDKPECGTFGCRGIGHVKGPKFATHNSASGCPYSPQNLNKFKSLSDRLNLKTETNDCEETEKISEKRTAFFEKRSSFFEYKIMKEEDIKQEDGESSDKNERMDSSERLGNKYRNNSDGQSDDDEVLQKRKKRRLTKDESSFISLNHDSSATRVPYAPNIPDKQLRLELYQSVYSPGYNPHPDPPHIWAKHSNALNRVVAKQNTNPRRWSTEEVIKFIQSVPNCKEISSAFRKQSIDGEAFLMMTQEDLISLLGLKLGHALKLYNSIVLLRKKAS